VFFQLTYWPCFIVTTCGVNEKSAIATRAPLVVMVAVLGAYPAAVAVMM